MHFFVTRGAPGAFNVLEMEQRKGSRPELTAPVEACDLANVSEAYRALRGATGCATIEIRRRSETYELSSVGVDRVDDLGLGLLSKWPSSYVDFERVAVIVTVQRMKPTV